ncbi:DNA-processing protein DprA, partial [Thomasclavelia sp.]|uniref:DNA-processing protein DprA n=1 Tax=Thomasclavelia sp. TaxID=3025757 RepID=UPI0025E8C884
DYCYPGSNLKLYENLIKNQLVLSEYPGVLVPRKENFPRRNRIISGLSESILVIEANQKSGTMITVGHALDQGKDIFAIPSRIDDARGCNFLIQQGAKLVMNVQDIISG